MQVLGLESGFLMDCDEIPKDCFRSITLMIPHSHREAISCKSDFILSGKYVLRF